MDLGIQKNKRYLEQGKNKLMRFIGIEFSNEFVKGALSHRSQHNNTIAD